jgi:translin
LSHSDDIAAAGDNARRQLDEKHRARETSLAACRKAIQACAGSIRAVHRQEFDVAEERSAEAAAHLADADGALAGHLDVKNAGFLHDAKKEYAEARLTLAFVRGDPLPSAEEMGVAVQAHLNGLAEAASELRRYILDGLRRGDLARGEELLATMDDVYSLLVTLDYPDALTGGLRRTTDALRAVLERTRGDLTTTMLQTNLQESIDRLLQDR